MLVFNRINSETPAENFRRGKPRCHALAAGGFLTMLSTGYIQQAEYHNSSP